MSATTLDIAPALRAAIIAADFPLAEWNGAPAVFTRRPVPADAPYPFVLINAPVGISDVDFLTTRLPVVHRDVIVYGLQGEGLAGETQYRAVDAMGYQLRTLFHRQPHSVDLLPAYSVVEIVVMGPMIAPTDDERIVGRAVRLRLKLRDLST